MKYYYTLLRSLLLCALLYPSLSFGQSVWIEPEFPTADHPVTIYMDKGSTSFFTDDGVYIHSGAVKSGYTGTFFNSDADYNNPDTSTPSTLMTHEGGTVWSFTMTPRNFFSDVGAADDVYRIGMVFRNEYTDTDPNNVLNNAGGYFYVDLHVGSDPSRFFEVSPTYPDADQPLTIRFKAAGTALAGLSGATASDRVYLHSAAVTSGPNGNNWGKTVGNWGQADGVGEMTLVSPDIWEITLTPETYYGLTANENAFKLAMVFRSADGSTQVKDGNNDIFYSINPGFFLDLQAPKGDPYVVEAGTNFNIVAETPSNADYTLDIDGTTIHTATGVDNVSYTHSIATSGDYTLTATTTNGSITKTKTTPIHVYNSVASVDYPAGLKFGPNYDNGDPTKVTLLLHMPTMNKEVIHVIGDFNNWTVSESYKMQKNTAGDVWWVEITGLDPGKEYVYQYLVDGNIRVGDPYAEKVSDPDDQWISEARYPGLIDYPSAKTTKRATVLQTDQDEYVWKYNDFQRPAQNELNIYEVLVRDFTEEGTFQGVIDKLDYIDSLGFNCIHLMPVVEFEGNESWGYNPNYYFAVDKWYGPKNKLKELIDEAHRRGIAVLNDLVLNHAFYSCAFAQLYWDQENNRPAADNPWLNPQHNFVDEPSAWWGADFNHESTHTKALIDSINDYWLTEYRFDGFRFDFTKGFSNTTHTAPDNWGSGYDAARVANLERMKNEMQSRHPGSYVIFEHLAEASEDKVLADGGIMMWGGAQITQPYEKIVLGYEADNRDLSGGVFNSGTIFNFQYANLMSYMESHDEERLAYELHHYGRNFIKTEINESGRNFDNYNEDFTGDMTTFIQRLKLPAAINLLLPGPRMVWQFGELGYDYSIDYNGRTGNKPVRWDYYDNPKRRELHDFYATLLNLRQKHDVFNNLVAYDLGGTSWIKWLRFEYNGTKVVVMTNFQAWKAGDGQNGGQSEFIDLGLGGIFNSSCSDNWYNVLDEQWDYLDLGNGSYTYRMFAGDIKIYANRPLGGTETVSETSSDGAATWSATWDTNGITFTIDDANVAEAAVVYFDTDPTMPVNGGNNTNGSIIGFPYDGSTIDELPFRADFAVYFKDGYREFRRADGSGGWTSNTDVTGNPAGWNYFESGCIATRRTFTVPWDAVTNGNGMPSDFNWLGYVGFQNASTGIYGPVPNGNLSGNTGGASHTQGLIRYYEVNTSSGAGASELNSYAHDGTLINDFGAVELHSFSMNKGSSITVNSDISWNVSGDFIVANGTFNANNLSLFHTGDNFDVTGGTFNAQNSTVVFAGNTATSVSGNPTFNNLMINNTAGITLNSDITITGTLELKKGVINTNGHKVILSSGATIKDDVGGKSYVNGTLERTGSNNMLFPVGNAGVYAPVQVTPDASGTFAVSYEKVSGGDTQSINVVAGTFEKVSVNEHWDITGTASSNIRLYTQDLNRSGINDLNKIVVAHYTGTQWESEGSTSFGTDAIGSYVVSGLVSGYSPFSFGGTTDQPLPVELLRFEAKAKDERHEVALEWETVFEANNSHFEVLVSTDGQEFSKVGSVAAKSKDGAVYSMIDRPEKAGLYYYQLRQVDKDGHYSLSKVVSVELNSEAPKQVSWKLAPNPVASGNSVSIGFGDSARGMAKPLEVKVFDLSGRILLSQSGTASANYELYLPRSIKPGLYVLQVQLDGRRWQKRLLVK